MTHCDCSWIRRYRSRTTQKIQKKNWGSVPQMWNHSETKVGVFFAMCSTEFDGVHQPNLKENLRWKAWNMEEFELPLVQIFKGNCSKQIILVDSNQVETLSFKVWKPTTMFFHGKLWSASLFISLDMVPSKNMTVQPWQDGKIEEFDKQKSKSNGNYIDLMG